MISTILPNLNEGKQLVIVILENRDINTGQLYKFEKLEGRWNQIGPAHLIAVGANGIAWAKSEWAPERAVLKKEGDKRSPAGIFPLTQTFGRVSVKKAKYLAMPYEEIGPNAQCIEDKKSKYYNQIVFDNTKVNPDWEQDDRMLREDNLYDWGIFVEHNNLKTPGDGSCIFIHIWRSPGKPTAGCTAMSKKHLTQLMYWLDASKNPDLVLMTRQDYNRIRKIIDLPQID
ncbi:MAG: hypothetical protein KJP00_03965 [Bacteroidia bacterium]|nr:hypothetical protein [Bacteroidia bacterium]